jgi:hypothetical protein
MDTREKLFNKNHKISVFEIVILFVGILLTYFGFRVVFSLYEHYGEISWLMMTTIFVWLILLVMFILLSLGVDTNKRQLQEITLLRQIVHENTLETRLLQNELKLFSKIDKDVTEIKKASSKKKVSKNKK